MEATLSVTCAPGTYYEIPTESCQLCPLGQYQTQAGQLTCSSCNPGYTTTAPGATSLNDCKRKGILCVISALVGADYGHLFSVLPGWPILQSGSQPMLRLRLRFLSAQTRKLRLRALRCWKDDVDHYSNECGGLSR